MFRQQYFLQPPRTCSIVVHLCQHALDVLQRHLIPQGLQPQLGVVNHGSMHGVWCSRADMGHLPRRCSCGEQAASRADMGRLPMAAAVGEQALALATHKPFIDAKGTPKDHC